MEKMDRKVAIFIGLVVAGLARLAAVLGLMDRIKSRISSTAR
jgi:hypothetical protein